ncbi:hypothetical protein CS369_21945 [Candidatus Symbiopectobacterium sp. 'North America']|nr:hypothetical protein [Candidatus Symbiopectobacterium sp. 'North America']
MDGIVLSDKRVQKLRTAAQKYKGTDKEKDILASLDLVISSITSKIVADQQAGMALKTSILKKDFIKEQITGTKNATGAGADSFAVIASTSAYKSQQFESEKLFSEQDAAKPLGDWYGDLVSKLTSYAQKYPELTTALSGATTAITALGAGAYTIGGLLAAWKILYGPPTATSGINPPPVPPGTNAPTVTPPGTRMPNLWGRLGRIAGKALVPLSVYQATQDAPLVQVERGDNDARQRLSTNQYANDTERLQDSLRAQPGALDAWDEIKAWWNKPRAINIPSPESYGVPGYVTAAPTTFPLLNQDTGIRPPPVPGTSADNGTVIRPAPDVRVEQLTVSTDKKDDSSTWWSKPTNIGNGLPPAVLGLPDWMRPMPAPIQPKQPERPIQATIRLEVDGRVLAETANEINSQQATRGSNGAYQ